MTCFGERTAVATAYRTLRIGYAERVTACGGGRSEGVVGSVTDVARAPDAGQFAFSQATPRAERLIARNERSAKFVDHMVNIGTTAVGVRRHDPR